jgi:osmotically-inducible protein OsmY
MVKNIPIGRNPGMALIMAAFLGIAAVVCHAAPSEPRKITDQQINDVVEQTLQTDSVLPGNQIDAKTSEGIVVLTGTVNNLMAWERAAKLAEAIRGVRGVVNTIKLEVEPVSDDALQNSAVSALFYDAATNSLDFKVGAKAGVVTLDGKVQSYLEKELAVHVVKGVKGVREVKDGITVKNKANRSDFEIAADVRRIIDIDVWLDSSLIITKVKGDIVILTGEVGSYAQYQRAIARAWTAGVKSVDAEGLKIDSWAIKSGQRKETIATKTDPQIRKAVQDTFYYDPRVYSLDPKVAVDLGVVTLTGLVDNLKAKRAAEQDAKNTAGVWHVRNLLKVRPKKSTADDKIAQNVKSALLRDPFLDGYQIDARAKYGVVTLTGAVDSFYEKAEADDIASRAVGVVDVKNNIAVNYPNLVNCNLGCDLYWTNKAPYCYLDASRSPGYYTGGYTSDMAVKNSIEEKMFWNPFVKRDAITVTVENGTVTLTGEVASWVGHQVATELAFQGGAWYVKNMLEVK